jgi:O-antigen/teichoic acid export membrane protein
MIKAILNKLPTSQKFNTDVIWNIASFGIMGVSGIVLTLIIAKFYGPATLGVFNLTYSVFIFLSQLVAVGIHLSILNSVVQHMDHEKEIQTIMNAGIFSTVAISILILFVIYFVKDVFGVLFHSSGVVTSLVYILPGLFFFSLNKLLLSFHNACRRMKAYAVFQALRYIFLISTLIYLVSISFDSNKISIIFTISELLLFLIVYIYSLRYVKPSFSKNIVYWCKEHIYFGFKAAIGNLLTVVNTRIDVLMLGIFASDKTVGIYSLAAMFVEGFNQLPIVVRTNVNPILTKYKFQKSDEELRAVILKGRNLFYKLMIPLGILAIILFPMIIYLLKLNKEFYNSYLPFSILMVGSLFSVGYKPFQMILNQAGYPGYQSLLVFLVFMMSVLLNSILIPLLGMIGAAMATAISFVSIIFFLKILVRKTIGIRI